MLTIQLDAHVPWFGMYRNLLQCSVKLFEFAAWLLCNEVITLWRYAFKTFRRHLVVKCLPLYLLWMRKGC